MQIFDCLRTVLIHADTTCTSTLFRTLRPDIVVDFKGSVYVVELTVPYETNCTKAKRRKKERYRHLRSELITACNAFEVITLEVTTLGFVSKDIDRFRRLLRTLEMNDERIIKKMYGGSSKSNILYLLQKKQAVE